MKKKDDNFDVPEDMLNAEFQEIANYIQKYEVEFPDETEIERTVDAVNIQLMRQFSSKKLYYSTIRFALSEVSFINPTFWIASIALYIFGALFSVAGQNPYFLIMALSPTPFILGMIEVFKGRDVGMFELETSCKFNAANVMLSKLFVIAVYNILLNFMVSVLFTFTSENLHLLKITICWLTPFTIVCGLTLLMASKYRSSYTVTCLMPIWIILCLSILSFPNIQEKLANLNTVSYFLLIALGVLFTAIQIKRLLSKTKTYFERNVSLEINF